MTGLGGKDQSLSSIADTGVHGVGPEENKPHHTQEPHPPSSLISPGHPGSFLDQTEINRLDEVGPRAVRFDLSLTVGSGSGARFRQ